MTIRVFILCCLISVNVPIRIGTAKCQITKNQIQDQADQLSWSEIVNRADGLLAQYQPEAGLKKIKLKEKRGSKWHSLRNYPSYQTLYLVCLNRLENNWFGDDFVVIRVTRAGYNYTDSLIMYPQSMFGQKVKISPVIQENGIRINGFNTEFLVTDPEFLAGYTVIREKYPLVKNWSKSSIRFRTKKGKVRTRKIGGPVVEIINYTPYSLPIHLQRFVVDGKNYLKRSVLEALCLLRENNVSSAYNGDILIADEIEPEILEAIPYIEQSDPELVKLDMQRKIGLTFERVSVRMAVNMIGGKSNAYYFTASDAGACGLTQFVESTYKGVVLKRYPGIGLETDFKKAMSDDLNSLVASAILISINRENYYNYVEKNIDNKPNLEWAELMHRIKSDQVFRWKLDLIAYNGGVKKVHAVLKKMCANSQADLPGYVRNTETRGYLEKFDYWLDLHYPDSKKKQHLYFVF